MSNSCMELLRSAIEFRQAQADLNSLLGTAPDLVRAEFGLACRGTDARRREPVQGRATTREQLRNVRNVEYP